MLFDLHNDYPTALTESECIEYASELSRSGVTAVAAIWTSEFGENALQTVMRITARLRNVDSLKYCPVAIEDMGFLSRCDCVDSFDFSSYAYCSLTWNYNNAFAGGALDDGRLTERGKDVVKAVCGSGCAIDVAHLNKKSFYDVISVASRVICSHTGFNGHARSLDADRIKELIAARAVIGLCAVTAFTDADTAERFESVIDGFVQKYGADNLAIGSDFNGSDDLPRDMRDYFGLSKVRDGLIKRGYGSTAVDKIFYRNAYSFLTEKKNERYL